MAFLILQNKIVLGTIERQEIIRMHGEKAGRRRRENYAITDLNKDMIIFHIKNIAPVKDSMLFFLHGMGF